MFLPIQGEPPMPPLIQIVIEEKKEEPEQKELTVEEKIERNYYECDESIEYIRADNAQCIPRPVSQAQPVTNTTQTQTAVRTRVGASSGWYPYGQCTYHVWSKRPVGQWNNASEWLWQARRDGWATGSTPRVGAIAWEPGHVSYVTDIHKNGTITVSEMNYQAWGAVSYRTAPASQFQYIY